MRVFFLTMLLGWLFLGLTGRQHTKSTRADQLDQAELNQQLMSRASQLSQRTRLAGLPVAGGSDTTPDGHWAWWSASSATQVQTEAQVRLALIDVPA